MKLNKDFFYITAIIILLGLCGQFYYDFHYKPRNDVSVYFSQNIKANEKLAETIRNADSHINFAIYTFTRTDIKDALLGAKHRGVEIQGVMDAKQSENIPEQKKILKELTDAGIPIKLDDHSGIMHLKTLVTEKTYFSGSYNWTASATNINDEIIEIGSDENIRSQYEKILKDLFNLYNH